MIIGMFQEKDIEVVFSYFPVWEMFFSMHVLSDARHHVSRKKWVHLKMQYYPELVKEIQELSYLTDSWTFIIDAERWKEIHQMEITEMISFLREKNIYQWNEWVTSAPEKWMTIEERDSILDVIIKYYETIFRKEEIILRPYILHNLHKEKEKCQKEGLWRWCGKVHPRLQIEQDEIIYIKNREYRFAKEEIVTLFVTVSTFLHPHLWLYNDKRELEIVKGIITEQPEDAIPEDLVSVFRVLGDSTRIRIIKYLMQGVNTTQALASKLQISEAAVSRHLKMMWNAGIVTKEKKSLYTVYEFRMETIDRIPTSFYETMLV